jgi:hypothetical protein
MVKSQSEQIVPQTLSRNNTSQKRAGGVAQSAGPEFKSQYHKKNLKLYHRCVCTGTLSVESGTVWASGVHWGIRRWPPQMRGTSV